MPHFQLLSCNVALAGDITNVVVRHEFNPVTYPELIILQALHGEGAVTEVFACGETEERSTGEEMQRLMETYRAQNVQPLFPGHNIQLPVSNDRFKPRLEGTKVNPRPAPASVEDFHRPAPPASPNLAPTHPEEPEPTPLDEIDPAVAAPVKPEAPVKPPPRAGATTKHG